MMMNYFQLFDIPAQFDVNLAELATRYLELQRSCHPDNFAAASERDRMLAVQRAANINDAYRHLKHPLLRAEHLLALRGISIDEARSFADPAFLMQQMELREALADAVSANDVESQLADIEQQLQAQQKTLLQQLAATLTAETAEQNMQAAVLINKLKFFFKLQQELEAAEQQLQD